MSNPKTDDNSESPIYAIFLSATDEPDGAGATFAWVNKSTGKRRQELIPGATKIQATYRGLLSILDYLPEGSPQQLVVVCNSALFCGQFHGMSAVRGRKIKALQARVNISIRNRGLIVNVICVPNADNRASKLLKRLRSRAGLHAFLVE